MQVDLIYSNPSANVISYNMISHIHDVLFWFQKIPIT